MESDDPGADNKTNICPICERGFLTLRGLNQHWTRGHSDDEIKEFLASKSQTQSSTTSNHITTWNKFQIINFETGSSSNRSYQQFDIIETDRTGDCLFSAVLKFLKQPNNKFINIPDNLNELRVRVVNFILTATDDGRESNFTRFKDNIVINLQQQIPVLSRVDESEQTIQSAYSNYMTRAGNYGTTAELCAMAELFNFGFYVIRENNPENYTCFDYGSFENTTEKPTLYLLFDGDISRGHFRLLHPIDATQRSPIEPGNYGLVSDYTSSRIKSIAHEHHEALLVDGQTEHVVVDSHGEKEKDESFEDFVLLMARCKRNIRVLKRVPRGARIMAATKLTKCIQDCLAEPHLDSKWKKLLTFAYATLRVPETIKNKSLSSIVKKNIEKAELIFPKPMKKKKSISMSKRVEYKIAEGNVKGAVKILSSSDTLAPQNAATFQLLQEKHPPPSREMCFPEPPDKDTDSGLE